MRAIRRTTTVSMAAIVCVVALAPAAWAGTDYPDVPRHRRPGPAALYAPAAHTPILSSRGRWDARPLMVSGAAAYRSGEFVYQDYLYDDHGANTSDAPFARPEPQPPTSDLAFGGMTGEYVYPTDAERFGYNAADLLELRIEDGARSLAYRVTLNTLLQEGSTAIAIGIDTGAGDRGAQTDWGHGLGSLGPLGVDHVLYTDGVTAEIDGRRVSTRSSVARNQIEVIVPHGVLDPGRATWTHYAVTGIADGEGGFAPVEEEPSEDAPGGAHGASAPPVFNVAFRYEVDGDEPMNTDETERGSRSFGNGNWREHGQAKALDARDISAFSATVDFGRMASGARWSNIPRTGYMNRIYVSRLRLGEGVGESNPWLLGRLQPYSVYVPTSYSARKPVPFMLVLHSLSGTHNQYAVISPHTYRDLAEERGAIALTTAGRGPDAWYLGEGEVDVFEAWADVARRYEIDFDRVSTNGYSMGGYGSFKLATHYPDLFGKVFTVVGPPGDGIWPGAVDTVDPETNTVNVLESLFNVPLMIWNGAVDELVPVSGVIAHAQRLEELGYRYRQSVFTADHFALGEVDEWDRGRDFLGASRVRRDPARVVYKVMPGADDPELGLVHDHAYWVYDVRVRSEEGDPVTGLVDATSHVNGVRPIDLEAIRAAGPDPLPYVERGLRWGWTAPVDPRRLVTVKLTNIEHVALGMAGTNLDTSRPFTIQISSDGPATVALTELAERGLDARVLAGDASVDRAGRRLVLRVDGGVTRLRVH